MVTIEPYLIHQYHQQISQRHQEAKNFHIVGFDILLDTKLRAWLMEINANPSFNMFLEKEGPLENGVPTVEKTLSELDKYLKSKVSSEAIHIVTGADYEGGGEPVQRDAELFTQVLPSDDMEELFVWNEVQALFETLFSGTKNTEVLTLYQFQKLSKVPFGNPMVIKADYDILYKNAIRRAGQTSDGGAVT